jgi:predicted nucleotidyltransferase
LFGSRVDDSKRGGDIDLLIQPESPDEMLTRKLQFLGILEREMGERKIDLGKRELTAADLDQLSKDDRRLLDQFAYRYRRLQDDMGNRLMPAALLAMGAEVSSKSMLDRLDRISWGTCPMPISGLTARPSRVALETPALLGYAGKLTAYCNKHYPAR